MRITTWVTSAATALILIIGLTFSPLILAAENNTLEERMLLLEQRLMQAEQRAARAEDEIRQLKGSVPATVFSSVDAVSVNQGSNTTNTPTLLLNNRNDLKFYGDVEFNMDAASRSGKLTSTKTSAKKDWAPGDSERWDINGRILLGVDGYRRSENHHFAGFSVQPLADLSGKMDLDDAAFFFGQEENWQIKIGRFEARDMFPFNQDTFIEYSGNTANDLYSDGYGYIYMMNEGRGRSGNGGNFLISKTFDNWYLELNTLIEDGSELFVDNQYHGMELDNKKNVVYLRPVIVWSNEAISVAAAMESNVVRNAYGYESNLNNWVDQSKRTGYGLNMTWDSLKNDPDNGMVVNVNTAYLDAVDESNFSAGINGLWHNVELGYIYAHNKIDTFNTSSINANCGSNCWLTKPGKYNIHTVHTSWKVPNIMNMDNFDIYLGAYASWVDSNVKYDNNNHDARYGARVRFKYMF